jgi:pseudouridine synthase
MEPIRLQKYLSQAGVASRRAAETLIVDGRVQVNGQVVTELGTKVDPERDRVTVDGRVTTPARTAWIAFHKPRGAVCTRDDPQGRTTIYDLLPDDLRALFTVGRLDADSEGLLLLTNEGDVANRMLHPRYGMEREYEVIVKGDPGAQAVRALMRGIMLDDGPARAERVQRLPTRDEDRGRLRIIVKEGRKREVRRMLEAVGHPVQRLRRVRYGPIRLGPLRAGEWRVLDERELAALPDADAKPPSGSTRRGTRSKRAHEESDRARRNDD